MKLYMIIFLSILYQTSVRGDTILVTLYAMNLEASSTFLGIIVASTSLFPMIFAAYAGKITDRVGFRLPLLSGMIGTGIALLLPYLFKDKLFILIVSQSLFGLCQFLPL